MEDILSLAVRRGLMTRAQAEACRPDASPARLVEDGFLTLSQIDLLIGASGKTVAGYRLIAPIGTGSMGRVYRAVPPGGGDPVAVKVLGSRPSLVREALAVAALWRAVSHPNVLRLLAVVSEPPAVVMPLVAFGSAGDALRREGRLQPRTAMRLARDVARGLQAAHAAGLVHGDVKPDNVLIGPEGEALLTDFVGATRRLGTPAFLAPERWDKAPASAASDLYALGATLFALLTGTPPFGSGPAEEVAARHREAPVNFPLEVVREIPLAAARTAERLMAKAASDRPPSAAAVADTLDAAIAGL